MSRRNGSILSDTNTMSARYEDSRELELKKLGVKREMEQVMKEYAKATGMFELANRKKKVGNAPNDWKRRG